MTNNVLSLKKHRPWPEPALMADLTARDGGGKQTDKFLRDAALAAEQHGCKFLFDFPAQLIGGSQGSAAAIVCPDTRGFRLVFLFVETETGEIILIDAEDAPARLVNFASSYANILASLPVTEPDSLQ